MLRPFVGLDGELALERGRRRSGGKPRLPTWTAGLVLGITAGTPDRQQMKGLPGARATSPANDAEVMSGSRKARAARSASSMIATRTRSGGSLRARRPTPRTWTTWCTRSFSPRGTAPRATTAAPAAAPADRHRGPAPPPQRQAAAVSSPRCARSPAYAGILSTPAPLNARGDVERALRLISEAKRITLLMAEVEEMSCPEIAAALGIPIGTVWTRLHAARRELRAALGSDEP